MSGFEVAGVVLGVLPLAIKAAKAYMDILSSMKDAKRNLKALVHDLETEQIRLETTCEVLLDGIVPHLLIDRLVRAPLGPEWALYSDQLRLRLWRTSTKFEEQVSEMLAAVKELQAKLCMEADGSVCSLM
jgi:exonuclease VII small subunit